MKSSILKKFSFFTAFAFGLQMGSLLQVDAQVLFTASTGNWSTAGNWLPTGVPASGPTQHLLFNRATTTSSTHNLPPFTLNRMDFATASPGTSTITIFAASGSTLTFDGVNPSINRTDSGFLTFNAGIVPAVIINQTLNVNAPVGIANGAVLLQGGLTGTGGVNINGNLSFRGGGLYDYFGDTVVNAGFRLTASGIGSGDQLSSNSAHTVNGQLSIAGGDNIIGSLSGSGEIRLTSNHSLSVGALNTDTLFSGTSLESGSFIKIGTGTQTLTGAFDHTGGTTISGGTLQIGNGGTTGSVAGNITNNASLVFNRSNNLTFGGVISGTGDLQKEGAGSLTLSGNSTYTGATTVNAGEFRVTGSLGDTTVAVNDGATLSGTGTISGTVNLNDGATLSPGTSAGTMTVGNLSLNTGSNTIFELGTVSDLVNVTDTLTLNGGGLTIEPLAGFGLGSYTLFNFGSLLGTLTDVSLLSTPSGFSYGLDLVGNSLALLVNALSTEFFWDGSNTTSPTTPGGVGGSGDWNTTATNWTNSAGDSNFTWVDGNTATFGGNAGTVTLTDNISVGGLEFLTSGYTINRTESNTLILDGVIDVTLGTGIEATISTPITGTGVLTKLGDGSLTLSGTNTYSGGTTLSGGTLVVTNQNSLGTGTLTFENNTVFALADPFSSLTLSNPLAIDGDVTFFFGPNEKTFDFMGDVQLGSGTYTLTQPVAGGSRFYGSIAGSGNLNIVSTGTGSITLGGVNTFTGITTVLPNTTLRLASASGPSIVGDLVINSGGQAFLEANNQFGPNSTVTVNGNMSLLTTQITIHELLGTGNIGSGFTPHTLTVESGEFGGVISNFFSQGPLNLVKTTGDTLILSGANTYSAGTTIEGGTLQIGNGGTTGSITGNIANNANLVFNRSNNLTFGGVISGMGDLQKDGAGRLTLSGTNTYAGATTVNAGEFRVTGSLGDTTVAVNDGATLSGTGTIAGTVNLNDGATLTPGTSAGTLTVGNLSLNNGSNTVFELGTVSDLVNVTNTLTLNGGGLTIEPLAGFGLGAYTLFNFGSLTGTLSDVSLLSTPSGFSYGLDLIGNSLALLVNALSDSLYWNGPNTTVQNVPDGTGGTGNWDNTTTNWTNAAGNSVSNWATDRIAVFAGVAGTVTLTENIEIGGLDFRTTGYTIDRTGSNTLIPDGVVDITLDAGIAATIEAPITGTGGIQKMGEGVLTVGEDNTYTGGTTILGGILEIGDGSSAGSGPITGNFVNHANIAFRVNRDYFFDGVVSGTGDFTQRSGILRLSAAQTYTGATVIEPNTILVLPTTLDQGLSSSTTVDVGSGGIFDFSNSQLSIAGLTGTGTVYSFGGAAGNLDLNIASGTSTFDGNFGGSFPNFAITKSGAGTQVFTGNSTYTGGTTINAGNLVAAHQQALGTGGLNIQGGNLVVPQPLQMGDDLNWSAGTIFQTLGNETTTIDVDGSLLLTGTGIFDFTAGVGFNNNTDYLILSTTGAMPFDPNTDFFGNSLFGLSPEFFITGSDLFVRYPGSLIIKSGPILQNSAPVGIPPDFDFVVSGQVITGNPWESNIINSLTFQPGSSLQVFNVLQVTGGGMDVPSGEANLFGGTIFVPGNFSKTGNGTLVFNSDANVQGEANVNAGSLLVNGAFFAGGGFSIQSGALLGGTGILTGNVFNNGTVAPGNSIGTLTINGDYTQTQDATLSMEMRSPSITDRLFITGKAFLSGTLAVNVLGNQMSFGDVVRILTAEGGISGGFDRITGAPSGFRIRPWMLNGGTTYNLIFAPQSYTQVAQGENQINLARALDQWIGVSERNIFDATLQLDLLRAEQYGAVFEAILPTIYGNLASTVFTDSYGDGRTVNQQALFARRLVQPSANGNGENGQDTAQSDEERLPTRDSNQWRVWADARGIYADSDPLSLNSEGGTILAGADLRLRSNLIGGLYVGGQSRKSRGSNPDFESDGPRFGVYGLLGFAENAYVSGVIGGGTSSTSVTRPIAFGGSASGDMDGYDWFTRLEGGYTFHAGGFRLTPFLGIQYSQAHFDGFTENSDSVFALAFDDWSVDRFEGFVGVDLSRPFAISEKYQFIPYGRLALRDTFNQKGSSLDARLNRGDGPTFRFDADDPDEDGIEYGGGIRLTTMEHSWSLNVGYTGFSGNETNFNQINVGFSWDL